MMPSDPVQALYYVLLLDSMILGLTILWFWAGVFVARKLGHRASYGLGALGLARPKPGYFAAMILGFTAGVGALVLSIPLTLLSSFVLERLDVPTDSTVQEPFMRGLQEWVGENPGMAIPTTVFVVVLFAPAVEEIVFRGAVFGGLRKLAILLFGRLQRRGKGAGGFGEGIPFVFAALASSAAFAYLHLEPVLLPALIVLAIVLCALYRWTGSLLAPITAHATFNSFATLIVILSGLGALPTQV